MNGARVADYAAASEIDADFEIVRRNGKTRAPAIINGITRIDG
jgi:hypothetical protein